MNVALPKRRGSIVNLTKTRKPQKPFGSEVNLEKTKSQKPIFQIQPFALLQFLKSQLTLATTATSERTEVKIDIQNSFLVTPYSSSVKYFLAPVNKKRYADGTDKPSFNLELPPELYPRITLTETTPSSFDMKLYIKGPARVKISSSKSKHQQKSPTFSKDVLRFFKEKIEIDKFAKKFGEDADAFERQLQESRISEIQESQRPAEDIEIANHHSLLEIDGMSSLVWNEICESVVSFESSFLDELLEIVLNTCGDYDDDIQ